MIYITYTYDVPQRIGPYRFILISRPARRRWAKFYCLVDGTIEFTSGAMTYSATAKKVWCVFMGASGAPSSVGVGRSVGPLIADVGFDGEKTRGDPRMEKPRKRVGERKKEIKIIPINCSAAPQVFIREITTHRTRRAERENRLIIITSSRFEHHNALCSVRYRRLYTVHGITMIFKSSKDNPAFLPNGLVEIQLERQSRISSESSYWSWSFLEFFFFFFFCSFQFPSRDESSCPAFVTSDLRRKTDSTRVMNSFIIPLYTISSNRLYAIHLYHRHRYSTIIIMVLRPKYSFLWR